MIKQWISSLTSKRIIIYLAMIAVAIYVVWYVIDHSKVSVGITICVSDSCIGEE